MASRETRPSDPARRTYMVVPATSPLPERPRFLYAHGAGVLHYKDDNDATVKQWPHGAMSYIALSPTHVLPASTGSAYTAAL